MKINIKVRLYVPARRIFYGGSNPPVFSKTFEYEFTKKDLASVLKHSLIFPDSNVSGLSIRNYVEETNVMETDGSMKNNSEEYIKLLVDDGWILDIKAAKHYRLVVPQ